ncbi:PilZ domain protein [Posidoniimonas corsicana]|uniref:PilZ domain protein n=2 Tax=Posidoniimonas corsicana TaxID=1938618 RepID=A0A5C5V395_9BACT|nr:PilZ domain protein [Posidoniimonas corsicana]
MISELWESVVEETQLPPGEENSYFKRSGIMPTAYDERRRHRRFYYRTPAVLRVGDVEPVLLGAYCRDISRNGMGLLSPRQFLPLQQARLIISESQWYDLRVRWCRRLGEQCYHVGCDFDTQEEGGPGLW